MNSDKQEKDYNLYTENIVESPIKKHKKALRGLKYICVTIMLSVIGGIAFFMTVKILNNLDNNKKDNNTTERVTISTAESTSSAAVTQTAAQDTTKEVTEPSTQLDRDEDFDFEIECAMKSIVSVYSVTNTSALFETVYENDEVGVVIIKNEGYYILTKYNTVKNADQIFVRIKTGEECSATLIKGDELTNMAILYVDKNEGYIQFGNKIDAIVLGNSSFLQKNEEVAAIGNICNGSFTYNTGRISETTDIVYLADSKYGIVNTNITSGNNPGGILINSKGEMVGLITGNYSDRYGTSLISAYAVSDIKSMLEHLANKDDIPYLGIMGCDISDDDIKKYNLTKGVFITDILANSPAYNAGLLGGDIIVKVGNGKVESFAGFRNALYNCKKGDTVTVIVSRRGKEIKYDVTLE